MRPSTSLAVLLCLTASTSIHAAPMVTGQTLNDLCHGRDVSKCNGMIMLFQELIVSGQPIDGKRLCWPDGLSQLVFMTLVGAEMQIAAAHNDVDLLEKSAPKILADTLERHFPCGSVIIEKEPD